MQYTQGQLLPNYMDDCKYMANVPPNRIINHKGNLFITLPAKRGAHNVRCLVSCQEFFAVNSTYRLGDGITVAVFPPVKVRINDFQQGSLTTTLDVPELEANHPNAVLGIKTNLGNVEAPLKQLNVKLAQVEAQLNNWVRYIYLKSLGD